MEQWRVGGDLCPEMGHNRFKKMCLFSVLFNLPFVFFIFTFGCVIVSCINSCFHLFCVIFTVQLLSRILIIYCVCVYFMINKSSVVRDQMIAMVFMQMFWVKLCSHHV